MRILLETLNVVTHFENEKNNLERENGSTAGCTVHG